MPAEHGEPLHGPGTAGPDTAAGEKATTDKELERLGLQLHCVSSAQKPKLLPKDWSGDCEGTAWVYPRQVVGVNATPAGCHKLTALRFSIEEEKIN